MTRSATEAAARRRRRRDRTADSGFTLVEMVIALLLLAIVLSALAPAFYGLLRASNTSNYRSIANGIAVQATEQMRSIPYYEIGFHTKPDGCPEATETSSPVILDSSIPAPIAALPGTQSRGPVTYRIQRCINWVEASNSDLSAYKQSSVTVTWTVNGVSGNVVQQSAFYPGGETYTYAQTGPGYDFAPGGTPPTTVSGTGPQPPTVVSVTADTNTDPTQNLLVSWTAPTSGPTSNITYEVFWTTNAPNQTNPYPDFSTGTGYNEQNVANGTSTDITVGPGTTAWVQVYTVYATALSGQSNTMSGSTQTSVSTPTTTTPGTTVPTTTTTTLACGVTGITVTPDGTSTSPEVLDRSGNPLQSPSVFTVSVSITGNCSGVTVGYNPSACVLATSSSTSTTTTTTTKKGSSGSSTCNPSAWLTPTAGSGGSGTLTATTPSGQTWSAGTQDFLVYMDGSIYSPVTEAQSYLCTENGNSGKC